jgi:hypothetical protein
MKTTEKIVEAYARYIKGRTAGRTTPAIAYGDGIPSSTEEGTRCLISSHNPLISAKI